MKKTKTVIITGASGLLGANLTIQFAQAGYHVVALYNTYPCFSHPIQSERIDLQNSDAVNRLIDQCQPDYVIHCAAATNLDWCQKNPEKTYAVNCDVSAYLAAKCNQIGAKLVYISTASVFNGKVGNYTEEDLPDPINVYAQSKLAGEQVVQRVLDNHLIIRLDMYGWNLQPKKSLAEWILDALKASDKIIGFDDVHFSPLLVNDSGKFIISMLEQDLVGIYHMGSSDFCSKYEFANYIATEFELDARLIAKGTINSASLFAPRPKNTTLNSSKLASVLDKYMPTVQSGIVTFADLERNGFVKLLKQHCLVTQSDTDFY